MGWKNLRLSNRTKVLCCAGSDEFTIEEKFRIWGFGRKQQAIVGKKKTLGLIKEAVKKLKKVTQKGHMHLKLPLCSGFGLKEFQAMSRIQKLWEAPSMKEGSEIQKELLLWMFSSLWFEIVESESTATSAPPSIHWKPLLWHNWGWNPTELG